MGKIIAHPTFKQLQASLAGFNNSLQADKSSVTAFIASYRQFKQSEPAYLQVLSTNLLAARLHVDGLLNRRIKSVVDRSTPTPPGKAWVPRNQWIPDNPNPHYGYRWQATNIARTMRQKLEGRHDR